jgi:hypothetical protein
MLLKLSDLLIKLNTIDEWNFVHIILTDGDDTASKVSLNELLNIMKLVGIAIKKEHLMTYYLGIGIY